MHHKMAYHYQIYYQNELKSLLYTTLWYNQPQSHFTEITLKSNEGENEKWF